MMRLPVRWLACAAAVAACTPARRPPAPAVTAEPLAQVTTSAARPVCRVAPDGSPLIAERGIGGTGAPPTQLAERGIGGTGIIGVVTGFASICLAGHEVALPADVPVEIGGAAADQRALRAGQVAAVDADGPADALYARHITVRYEVEGPVEDLAPNRLRVAGQTVLLSPDTWLRTPPALGQWVAVSGLRDDSGAIAATRLDLVSTRTFIVHGVVQQDAGSYRVGALPIVAKPGDVLVPGLPVSITGVYGDGVLREAAIAPDLLAADPVSYFGGDTNSFILEGFGTLPLLQAPASSRPIGAGRTIVEFQRTSGGGIRINSVTPNSGARPMQPAALPAREGLGRGSSGRTFEPAPMPNRAVGLGGRPNGFGGNRFGDGGGRGPGLRPQGGTYLPGSAGSPGDGSPPAPGFDPGAGGGGGGRRR